MPEPTVVTKHTGAFFGAAIAFMLVTAAWNIANLTMLAVSVQTRYEIGMGIVSAMFATVVVSKVVRDREEADRFVTGIQQARYEQVLAGSPAPGLGHF